RYSWRTLRRLSSPAGPRVCRSLIAKPKERVMSAQVPGEKPGTLIHYTVDGEPQSTTDEEMTPRDIMGDAGVDPQTHILTEIDGGTRRPHRADPARPIRMREQMQFVTVER